MRRRRLKQRLTNRDHGIRGYFAEIDLETLPLGKEAVYFYSECCRLAYRSRLTSARIWSEAGFEHFHYVSVDRAQVHVVVDDERIIVSFRGTQNIKEDKMLGFRLFPTYHEKADAYVHSGFKQEYDKVGPIVASIVENYPDRSLDVCGHSMGGCFALLFAYEHLHRVRSVYTYGSPRVGNDAFVRQLNGVDHHRVVNCNDIICFAPPPIFYRHHATAIYLTYEGDERELTVRTKLIDFGKAVSRCWKKGEMFDSLRDHGVVQYSKKLIALHKYYFHPDTQQESDVDEPD